MRYIVTDVARSVVCVPVIVTSMAVMSVLGFYPRFSVCFSARYLKNRRS